MKTNQMTWALAAALTTSSLFIACDESNELLPDNPDTPQHPSCFRFRFSA